MEPSLFEKFKRQRLPSPIPKKTSDIRFALGFDERDQAFITVQTPKGKAIDLPDYHAFSGQIRQVLKRLKQIREQNAFHIQWGARDDAFYLADEEALIETLARCSVFVSEEGRPIRSLAGNGSLKLQIHGSKRLHASLELDHPAQPEGALTLLSEIHVLVGDQVCVVQPLGPNFASLKWFQTSFQPEHLAKFLALACSYLGDLPIRYKDFIWQRGGEKKAVKTLLFEKIDEDGVLTMRVCLSVPGLPVDFLEGYDLEKVAFLNDMEKTITVFDLTEEDLASATATITRLLKKVQKKLAEQTGFFQDHGRFMIDSDLAKAFLEREFSRLMKDFTVFGAEELAAYKIRVGLAKLSFRLHHGLDFLEGDADLCFDDQNVDLFEALQQFRNKGYVALADGSKGLLDKDYLAKLERLIQKRAGKARVSFFDLPLVEDLLNTPQEVKPIAHARAVFEGLGKLHRQKVTLPKLNGRLRPYQKQGFQWLKYLYDHHLGGCLADEMGLGKTLQTLALLAHLYAGKSLGPTLVVMPRSLLFNWERELLKFTPQLTYVVYYGMDRNWQKACNAQIIFTTYGLVRNDIETLRETHFHGIVLDESQNIKNINAQTTKAVLLLKAHFRFALSGTPLENHLGELYSLFRFLNPTMFGSHDRFNRNYANPIHKNQDAIAMDELRRKIYPFILRRLKRHVAKDLPEKVEQVLYVDMEAEHMDFYEQRRRFYKSAIKGEVDLNGIGKAQFFIFQALNELRQIAAIPELKSDGGLVSPKRSLLTQHVAELVANGHKVLIYANFLGILQHLAEDFDQLGIGHLSLTGATRDRGALVDRFQNDQDSKVFLLSLKAGGVGLNLTAADYVFIFDPWWNRAAENQAIDRAHRIGQRQAVFCYRLITRGTIEEKILQLQEMKAAIFDSLIGADGAKLKAITEEDLAFMLGDT